MFENNIFGMIAPKDWLNVGLDVTRPDDPVDQLFGDIKTDNLRAYWETQASEYGIPVMAQYHAFDTEAQKTMRKPVDIREIEKGLIKVKLDQSERLLALLNNGVNRESELRKRVLNDGYNLSEEVFTRTKVAKNEVLYSGKMTINENNLNLTVDYGVPTANLQKQLDFGAGAATPLDEQLLALTAAARTAGAPINGLYTSGDVLIKMRKNPSIQKAINGAMMVGQLVRVRDLEAYLAEEFGIGRVLVNDAIYSLPLTEGENGRPVTHPTRYYPVDKISFFHTANGTGKIGDGLWGDPPSVQANKVVAVGNTVATSEVSPYVFVSQYKENDPDTVWTKAEGVFIPVLYNPNALYVASVTETPGA